MLLLLMLNGVIVDVYVEWCYTFETQVCCLLNLYHDIYKYSRIITIIIFIKSYNYNYYHVIKRQLSWAIKRKWN